TGSTNSWGYAIFWAYSFTDYTGTVFAYFGNPYFFTITSSTTPDAGTFNFSAVQSLLNSSTTNYDVANVTVRVYRTINGGQNYFFLTSFANGVTTFSDSISDATIQN